MGVYLNFEKVEEESLKHQPSEYGLVKVFAYKNFPNSAYFIVPAPCTAANIEKQYDMGFYLVKKPYFVSKAFLENKENYN